MKNSTNQASRISDCIVNTLSQEKLLSENNHYSVTPQDLHTWDECPLCNSKSHTRISDVSLDNGPVFFSTDICDDCLHIFRKTSPNIQWFEDRWRQISTGELVVYNRQLEEKRRVRYELYYGILHKYKNKGLLLDVGAAYGAGTNVFISRGFDAEALEPEDDRAAYIKKTLGIECHNSTLESLLTEKKYDLILFSHCLEHLNDPRFAMEKLKSCLSKDGIIYLEIPIVWNIIDWQDSFFMAHKQNFTEHNLKKLVFETGFNILDSYLVPDNDGLFCNLGLVITSASSSAFPIQKDETMLIDPLSYTKNSLMDLYKINIPTFSNDSNSMHFSVPYIDNFYHIVKGDKKKLLGKI